MMREPRVPTAAAVNELLRSVCEHASRAARQLPHLTHIDLWDSELSTTQLHTLLSFATRDASAAQHAHTALVDAGEALFTFAHLLPLREMQQLTELEVCASLAPLSANELQQLRPPSILLPSLHLFKCDAKLYESI